MAAGSSKKASKPCQAGIVAKALRWYQSLGRGLANSIFHDCKSLQMAPIARAHGQAKKRVEFTSASRPIKKPLKYK